MKSVITLNRFLRLPVLAAFCLLMTTLQVAAQSFTASVSKNPVGVNEQFQDRKSTRLNSSHQI